MKIDISLYNSICFTVGKEIIVQETQEKRDFMGNRVMDRWMALNVILWKSREMSWKSDGWQGGLCGGRGGTGGIMTIGIEGIIDTSHLLANETHSPW